MRVDTGLDVIMLVTVVVVVAVALAAPAVVQRWDAGQAGDAIAGDALPRQDPGPGPAPDASRHRGPSGAPGLGVVPGARSANNPPPDPPAPPPR